MTIGIVKALLISTALNGTARDKRQELSISVPASSSPFPKKQKTAFVQKKQIKYDSPVGKICTNHPRYKGCRERSANAAWKAKKMVKYSVAQNWCICMMPSTGYWEAPSSYGRFESFPVENLKVSRKSINSSKRCLVAHTGLLNGVFMCNPETSVSLSKLYSLQHWRINHGEDCRRFESLQVDLRSSFRVSLV